MIFVWVDEKGGRVHSVKYRQLYCKRFWVCETKWNIGRNNHKTILIDLETHFKYGGLELSYDLHLIFDLFGLCNRFGYAITWEMCWSFTIYYLWWNKHSYLFIGYCCCTWLLSTKLNQELVICGDWQCICFCNDGLLSVLCICTLLFIFNGERDNGCRHVANQQCLLASWDQI